MMVGWLSVVVIVAEEKWGFREFDEELYGSLRPAQELPRIICGFVWGF